MFDIFYISSIDKNSNSEWNKFKSAYPVAKYSSSFRDAQKKSLTKFFWVVWEDLIVNDDFKFDYVPDEWSDNFVHVFLNDKTYDGIILVPKKSIITDKELLYRFFVNNKQVAIVASKPKPYNVFEIDTYEEYLAALNTSTTELFWMSSKNIIADIPDIHFDYSNVYDRTTNHAFLHNVNNELKYDGLFLCSKHKRLSKREVEHRHPVDRKEWDIVASKPKPYDIVFISYQETNADENYEKLLKKNPSAKRIHGVKGIHQAHIKAAESCNTDMFWIVDGDALIVDDFDFDYQVARWDRDAVHVWRSRNPINDLVYGYGGVKLFPRILTINMDTSKPDMTTSITNKFKAMPSVSNITAFNTTPFETWRSAFRECTKLASKIIDRQKDDETNNRLKTWCTVGEDRLYGKYAIAGATAGATYGSRNQGNLEALKKINDFEWLKEQFSVRNS